MSLRNIEAFGEFKSALKNPTELSNGDLLFDCRVKFVLGNEEYEEDLKCKLVVQGYDGGTVSIEEEGNVITIDRFHTEFKNKFGDFVFDPVTDTLSIESKSSKLGRYKVFFTEL
jgi:hypothetical protein